MGGVEINKPRSLLFAHRLGIFTLAEMGSINLVVTCAGGHVQGGEQRRGAVADVVVGDPLDVTQPHGQHRLGALQGLDLAFFVHAQDHGVVGRVQVQPDDVADFFDEEGGRWRV